MHGIINFRDNGHASIEIDGERYFIYKDKTKNALPGDTVQVKTYLNKKKKEAKVMDILERGKTKFVGIIEKSDEYAFVKPLKPFGTDFFVDKKDFEVDWDDIENGDKVVIEIIEWKRKEKSPNCKLIERLGKSLDNDVEMHSIILEYGFDTKFPEDVIAEAELVSDIVEVTDDRVDMRSIPTFTIDPETAKDFDDALSIVKTINGYTIGVHIADVSHYVPEDSIIDKEALNRATSVYLVDRTIPMLPERLSNGLCSLNPNVDRYAFSVMFDIADSGRIRNYWMQNSVINSNKRYSYEEALDVIEGKEDEFEKEIRNLCDLSLILREKRSKDNIQMKRKEAKFNIDENGKPLDLFFKEPTKSTELIEEFMLLANKHIGLEFHKKGHTFIWRTHDEPNLEKISLLEAYLELVGMPHKIRDENIKEDINLVLKMVEDTYLHEVCSTMAMRSMSKAVYTTNNIGHYGLGFDTYSHFTSPIRRYPDLIAHRVLKKFLKGKVYNYPSLEEKCTRCNQKEVQAQRAERDSIKYKQAEYMQQFIGQEFKGNVSYIMSKRVFVILENGIEASFPINYSKENKDHLIYVDGIEIRIGEEISVIIKDCDLFKKEINLKIKI